MTLMEVENDVTSRVNSPGTGAALLRGTRQDRSGPPALVCAPGHLGGCNRCGKSRIAVGPCLFARSSDVTLGGLEQDPLRSHPRFWGRLDEHKDGVEH